MQLWKDLLGMGAFYVRYFLTHMADDAARQGEPR